MINETQIHGRVKTMREAVYTRYLDHLIVEVHAHKNDDEAPLYFTRLRHKDGRNSAPPTLTAGQMSEVLNTISAIVAMFENEVSGA